MGLCVCVFNLYFSARCVLGCALMCVFQLYSSVTSDVFWCVCVCVCVCVMYVFICSVFCESGLIQDR